MLEQDVTHRAPEVAPVGRKRMGLVGFDITALGGLYVFECDGGMLVVVEGGQEAGLDADVQLLHLGRVEAEIMTAQRADSHQFHLSLENVDRHRKLVQPGAAQQFAPEVDAIVVGELAAVLKTFVLQHVGLEVFGVGVHRAELIDADHLAVVAHATELDQGTAGRVIVPNGSAELAADDEEFTFVEAFVDDFEAGPVHTAEQFDAMVGAVLALGHPHIEPSGGFHLGEGPVPEIVHGVKDLADETGMSVVDDLALEPCRAAVAPDVSAIHKGLVCFVEEGVEMADAVKGHAVDNELGIVATEVVERVAVIGVDNESAVVEGLAVGVEPMEEFADAEVERGLEDLVEIFAGGDVVVELGTGFDAFFRIVLGDEVGIVAEGDPGAFAVEEFHWPRASMIVWQTLFISSSVMYGCIGKDSTRSQRVVALGQGR